MRLSELGEVETEARDLLAIRAHRIEEGRIDGHHWFVALVEEARMICRRQRAWAARRAW